MINTITKADLKEGDLLFYRGNGFFSWLIRINEALVAFDFKKLFIAFTHTAQVVYERECDCLLRFDAMEGLKTGFRPTIGKAYVFRWKEPLTARQLMVWRNYLLAREGSSYDRLAVLSMAVNKKSEDVFKDICSEISMNALMGCGKIPNQKSLSPYKLYRKYRSKLDFIGVII